MIRVRADKETERCCDVVYLCTCSHEINANYTANLAIIMGAAIAIAHGCCWLWLCECLTLPLAAACPVVPPV